MLDKREHLVRVRTLTTLSLIAKIILRFLLRCFSNERRRRAADRSAFSFFFSEDDRPPTSTRRRHTLRCRARAMRHTRSASESVPSWSPCHSPATPDHGRRSQRRAEVHRRVHARDHRRTVRRRHHRHRHFQRSLQRAHPRRRPSGPPAALPGPLANPEAAPLLQGAPPGDPRQGAPLVPSPPNPDATPFSPRDREVQSAAIDPRLATSALQALLRLCIRSAQKDGDALRGVLANPEFSYAVNALSRFRENPTTANEATENITATQASSTPWHTPADRDELSRTLSTPPARTPSAIRLSPGPRSRRRPRTPFSSPPRAKLTQLSPHPPSISSEMTTRRRPLGCFSLAATQQPTRQSIATQ